VRLVFQRPQYAARDRGDVGVAAPARDGEPVRYLHKVALRLVVWFDLAVSAQQIGAVLAQAPQRPISLVRRTLVIVREFRRPAFAVIILAPAAFVLVADEPDRVGAVAERNADMTLSLEPEALGFAVMLACRGGIDRPSVAPACDELTHEQRRHPQAMAGRREVDVVVDRINQSKQELLQQAMPSSRARDH